MNILLTLKQILTIKEQVNMQYTPEKIDQFVQEGEKDINKATEILRKYYHSVMTTTIGDVSERVDEVLTLVQKLDQTKKVLNERMEFYFDVVNMYEVGEYPDNLKRLDDIGTEIDNLQMDIGDVKDAFECLMDSSKYLIKLTNKDKL